MGIFDFFTKQTKPSGQPAGQEAPVQEKLDTEVCSNIRVEVTALDGRMLFVAKLVNLRGNTAELNQYSESELAEDCEPLPVRIRGYNDHYRKAVYMEGVISPKPRHVWQVDELVISRIGNDRAFFRLDTNLDATVNKFTGRNSGERPCKLLNISVGGACIGSDCQYWEQDKLLLTVKLLEDREPSIMYCQVLRVIEKGKNKYEYGCQFLELNEADEGKITQNIFTVQRKMRSGSR